MNIEKMQDFLSQKWLPNLLGLLGGSLGVYSFIDNYVLRFSPKFYVASQVFFVKKKDNQSREELDKIVLSVELSNKRKKYGIVYDLAIKIYRVDEVNPEVIVYYASETGTKLSIDTDVNVKDIQRYSPLSVLPNSSKSAVVVFGDVVNRSKCSINDYANYYYELYYQLKPDGSWRFSNRAYLYNLNERNFITSDENPQKNLVSFTSLDYDTSRDKLNKIRKKSVRSIYEGASSREKRIIQRTWKYKIFTPFYYLKDVLIIPKIYLQYGVNRIYDRYFRIPIIRKYSVLKPTINIKFGRKEFVEPTKIAFDYLHSQLFALAEKLNENSKPDLRITIRDKTDRDFNIACYHMSLKIYISGDGNIRVQETNSGFKENSKVRYNLNLRENHFQKRYWHLENQGYITIESFAIRVADFLLLHHGSHH